MIVQGGLIGRLSKRYGEWPLVILGPVLVTAAMLLYVEAGWKPIVALLVIGTLCNATGRSLQTPTLSALISKFADPKLQGTTFGLFHMLGSLARVIGPIVSAWAYTYHHTAPFWLAASLTAAIAVWTVTLRAHLQGGLQPLAAPSQRSDALQ